MVLAEWERWGSQRPNPVVAYAEIWKVRTIVEAKRHWKGVEETLMVRRYFTVYILDRNDKSSRFINTL